MLDSVSPHPAVLKAQDAISPAVSRPCHAACVSRTAMTSKTISWVVFFERSQLGLPWPPC